MGTLYWHDYETWGEVPSQDRPSQFAGLRTDLDLNPVGEPLVIYCQPAVDTLPKPEACLVTGISPQTALREGLPEPQFIAAIHEQLAFPGTCGVGYNTLRFDDEVTRYALYRNFYDPYEREWRNGNSRWDIIDMVRMTYALRPDGIQWPTREDGKPSFKLEHLTAANGISHEGAHDALSDVTATIDLARLIKSRQPKLFDYLFSLRRKRAVSDLIDLDSQKPLLHVSSRFPAENGCAALVMPLAMHPVNKNAVIVANLSASPEPLINLSAEEISQKLYMKSEQLAEGEERIPLKLVHMNKSPALATARLLDDSSALRLNINLEECRRHWQRLRQSPLREKLQAVFSDSPFSKPEDPEQQLYDGFFSDADRRTCETVRRSEPGALAQLAEKFEDTRLQELLFRYRGRYHPQTLSESERRRWHEWTYNRFTQPEYGGGIVHAELKRRLQVLRQDQGLSAYKLQVLDDLEQYADRRLAELSTRRAAGSA